MRGGGSRGVRGGLLPVPAHPSGSLFSDSTRQMAAQKIILYGDPRSNNTQKVALMLVLTGTKFGFAPVDILARENLTPDFLVLNPFGKVPVFVHGDTVIRQSHDALRYLYELTDQFGPTDRQHDLAIGEWLGFSMDFLSRGTVRVRHLTRLVEGDPAVVAHYRITAERGVGIVERHLKNTPWLAGEAPTIADFACYPGLVICPEADIDLADHPAIAAWLARVESLPGFVPAEALTDCGDNISETNGGHEKYMLRESNLSESVGI